MRTAFTHRGGCGKAADREVAEGGDGGTARAKAASRLGGCAETGEGSYAALARLLPVLSC